MKIGLIALCGLIAINSYAAEVKTQPSPDKPAAKSSDFFSGLYIAPVGIVKYANLTDKPQYGAGLAFGFNLNKYVALDVVNIAFKTPDNWENSAIDETDLMARFSLFTAAKGKLTLYGTAGGSREWELNDWGLGIGAGLDYNIGYNIDIFGQYVYQVWKVQEQSGQVQFGIGYNF